MYKVFQKLKRLKLQLNKLDQLGFFDVQAQTTENLNHLLAAQELPHQHLKKHAHSDAERVAAREYRRAPDTNLRLWR